MEQIRPERLGLEASATEPRHRLWLVLDNIRSALNVGSLFRSADAFRLGGICLCGYTAGPENRDVRKSALGAEDSVPYRTFASTEDCLRTLKAEGYHILALEQTDASQALSAYRLPPTPSALVLGNEVDGVAPEALALCDAAVEIPQAGIKHSLNVAVAGGIALWELTKSEGRG